MNWFRSPDLFGLTVATSKVGDAGDDESCGAPATWATAPITHHTRNSCFMASLTRRRSEETTASRHAPPLSFVPVVSDTWRRIIAYCSRNSSLLPAEAPKAIEGCHTMTGPALSEKENWKRRQVHCI